MNQEANQETSGENNELVVPCGNITAIEKPLLTPEQQIEHLKAKGVKFDLCSEEDASKYLCDKTYLFKIAAYRTLFEKRVGGEFDGQYVGLDFGHLQMLASVDRALRYTMLPLTLDIEHFARTKLMRMITLNEEEDGYSLVADYMASLNHDNRRRRVGEIKMLEADAYCGALVKKYDIDHMPVWVFLELVSFGSFIDLYLFCANRWDDDQMKHEHYMLRQTKAARNASAHSSNVVNGFVGSDAIVKADESVRDAIAAAGISQRVRNAKMRNPRLQQIATLLYLHKMLVPEGTSKDEAATSIAKLSAQMSEVMQTLPDNDAVRSSFGFLNRLFDKWF